MKTNSFRIINIGNIPKYNTYLVDVWGVIYDGYNLINSGMQVLDEAMRYGKVILVSNTSRTDTELINMLEYKGMDTSKLSRVITSGMLAQQDIKDFINKYDINTFYHIGSIEPSKWLHELSIKMNDTISTSDIVICSNLINDTEDSLIQLMSEIKAKSLPVFITNPDKKVSIKGEFYKSAGIMIDFCKTMGIQTFVYGKPETGIFLHAMRSVDAKKNNTCMIGDSLETDILGANRHGIDSILVHNQHSVQQIEPFSNQNKPTYRVFL